MRLKYKGRLFLYFSLLFALFTASIIIFERSQERRFRSIALEEKLDAYTVFIHNLIDQAETPEAQLSTLIKSLHQDIRVTLIDKAGKVIYDNYISDISMLGNHFDRPEIHAARSQKSGTHIRLSSSNEIQYVYYAKDYGSIFVRVALPYDAGLRKDLKSDNTFLYVILALFLVSLIFMTLLADRFAKSIRQLHDFATATERDEHPDITFPDDELGEIGNRITHNYNQLKEKQIEIANEREKLLQHVQSSEEGICFYDRDREVEFYNSLFLQYLNILIQEPTSSPSDLFRDPVFAEVKKYLEAPSDSYFETRIEKHGKTFSLHVNLFESGGCEVILNDVTLHEKTRRLKEEMTGNIAHELRTPVTSIRGYLETILEHNLDPEKAKHFVAQAHKQTMTLSEIIRDMSLITKMTNAPQSFALEAVDIADVLDTIKEESQKQLAERNINLSWDVPPNTIIQGNPSLIYSIFRNLTDNAIRYAGEGIAIRVSKYNQDSDFYYFSFSDTGIGIPDESHFNRLFERFYRINEGRTRDSGGSGLGLSIVKNAVLLHKGDITVRNRNGGGLEFLFRLHR
ncbi:cell wall metabolism sensor histidine kinase WalK [Porphyromonas sp.]|uniref:sensor histidine kinase n=1 Tax=Porphyromonas sp. TaxID=1924944 RepID=UPI0026DB9A15|nr:ATP-binding protein [Porphyromonas sp.]MDO4695273.1 ATP-binding protein [Porphyromonas sp.]MDO4770689.1 ATP-binding protein [Porphyromonas sp.]